MLAVLSPAKKLDFTPAPAHIPDTSPALLDDAALIAERAKQLTPADLKRLMSLSDKLADLNYARFQAFGAPRRDDTAKPAAFAFTGDTYVGFDAPTLPVEDLEWAQEHVRILSGLYGVLRPLDLIEPYRLEMGTKLDTSRGKDLYAFWRGRISAALDAAVAGHAAPVIVNVASTEYFKAADDTALKARVVTPVFKEETGDAVKVIGLMAKRARGMMARYIVTHRLEDPEALKDFREGGYTFRPEQSDADTWVFTRPKP